MIIGEKFSRLWKNKHKKINKIKGISEIIQMNHGCIGENIMSIFLIILFLIVT